MVVEAEDSAYSPQKTARAAEATDARRGVVKFKRSSLEGLDLFRVQTKPPTRACFFWDT